MSLSYFREFQKEFNTALEGFVQHEIKNEKVRERLRYCLEKGKRLRPIICMDIGRHLTEDRTVLQNCQSMAIALELIHNASLIIDDMPAMDNDHFRRGKPAYHVQFSQSEAQLTAGFLVQQALSLIMRLGRSIPAQFHTLIQILTKNMGVLGLAGGQLQDLTPFSLMQNSTKTKKELIAKYATKDMIRGLFLKKTCSLFEMAFCCGYLGAQGNPEHLESIQKAAYHFGIAFQIYDDYDDIEQDLERAKTGLFDPNYVNNFGLQAAYDEFQESLSCVKNLLTPLGLYTQIIQELVQFLTGKVEAKHNSLVQT